MIAISSRRGQLVHEVEAFVYVLFIVLFDAGLLDLDDEALHDVLECVAAVLLVHALLEDLFDSLVQRLELKNYLLFDKVELANSLLVLFGISHPGKSQIEVQDLVHDRNQSYIDLKWIQRKVGQLADDHGHHIVYLLILDVANSGGTSARPIIVLQILHRRLLLALVQLM